MPREQINYPDTFVRDPAYDKIGIHGQSWPNPVIHVSWYPQKDDAGYAQVSIQCPTAYIEHMAALVRESDGPEALPDTGFIHAFSPALKRHEINKLIRVLRRARDQAYGRDE